MKFSCQGFDVAGGQAGVAGLLDGGVLFGLGLGHVDDPVELELHLGQIAVGPFGQKVGIGSVGILAAGDGVVDAGNDQHDGDGDDQCKDDPVFGTLPVGILIAVSGGIIVIMVH